MRKFSEKRCKYLSFVMSLVFVIQFMLFPVGAISIGDLWTNNSEVIYSAFDRINHQDWASWANHYANAVRDKYITLISNPQNFTNNTGILTVNNIQILNIEKVDNSYVPHVYPELEPYFSSPRTYECYKVCANLQVNEETRYFHNGVNNFLVTLVFENDAWKLGAMSYCPNALLQQLTPQSGHLNPRTEPSIIYFKDENGIIRSSSFTEFIVNGTCNEVGNMGYTIDALKANAMAVKMVGWYCVWAGYFIDEGYDIPYGWVACMSYYSTSEENTQTVRNVVASISDYRMVTSTGQLFYASYFAGDYDYSGFNSGQLRQNGCQYLSYEWGYTWEQILHYYYDNSSFNANSSVGTIQITNASLG